MGQIDLFLKDPENCNRRAPSPCLRQCLINDWLLLCEPLILHFAELDLHCRTIVTEPIRMSRGHIEMRRRFE